MIVYRLSTTRYSTSLDASGRKNRWNSEGNKVIYTGSSTALSVLELMYGQVNIGFGLEFSFMYIEIPDGISIQTIPYGSADLPPGWDDKADLRIAQRIGDEWYKAQQYCVLQVPTILVPDNYNFVINTTHSEFAKIKLIKTFPYIPHTSIEQIVMGKVSV